MAKAKKKTELKAAELPELVALVEQFKDSMKKQNIKWKRMGRKDALIHLREFCDSQLDSVTEAQQS